MILDLSRLDLGTTLILLLDSSLHNKGLLVSCCIHTNTEQALLRDSQPNPWPPDPQYNSHVPRPW
jgi:hypothetical protein